MKRILLIAGIGLLALSTVLLTGGLVQFILPPVFESVARIVVLPGTNEITSIYGPTDLETLQSRAVLYPVITNLDLNRKWGEKFKESELQTETTYTLLKSHLNVRQAGNTQIIEIGLENDDPVEAAAIANTIAEVYRNQRKAYAHEMDRKAFKAIEAALENTGVKIETLEKKVKQLGAQFSLEIDSQQPPGLEKDDPRVEYYKMRRDWENMKYLRDKVTARFLQEKIDGGPPKPSPVEIIDQAVPNLRPIKPHPLLKILVPVAGLLAGVLGVCGLMLAVMLKRSAQEPPSLSPT
jgi:uncharacterized protein involved in exopolysaccharide biosynthesis